MQCGYHLDVTGIPLLNACPELTAVPEALQDAVEEAVVLSHIVLETRSQNAVTLCV